MLIPFESLVEPISAIHATPTMVVIGFAGAGAQALAWLHGVGGSSRTLLEATDYYAAASMIEAIGFEPEHFTGPDVARAMATQAYIRACHLADAAAVPAGIACTATIATDRIKRGDHRACVAICTAEEVTIYELTLAKGRRTRREEEQLVSLLILKAVAKVCGITGLPELELFAAETLVKQVERRSLLDRLLAGDFNWVAVSPQGRMTPGRTWPNIALLSGAFNPLHAGHRQMVETASELLQQEVYFELPLINAAKGALELAVAEQRLAQFTDIGTVILTRAPLFGQKAEMFPHSVFVIGVDTAARLVQPGFYNNDPAEMVASFETIRRAGCRFLVAGRLDDDRFMTLSDVDLPAGYRELFTQIPEQQFRLDISSTDIRERQPET
jgi:nicotinic acid mononucleotide adenylyltransferase